MYWVGLVYSACKNGNLDQQLQSYLLGSLAAVVLGVLSYSEVMGKCSQRMEMAQESFHFHITLFRVTAMEN